MAFVFLVGLFVLVLVISYTYTSRAVPDPISDLGLPKEVSVSESSNDSRCSFHRTEPRVPDPVGLPVYDCEAWEVAYKLLVLDQPEVAMSNFDNESRIDLTHWAFNQLRKSALDCNTDIYQITGIVMVIGDTIESRGFSKTEGVVDWPRMAALGILGELSGDVDTCRTLAVLWAKDQIGE